MKLKREKICIASHTQKIHESKWNGYLSVGFIHDPNRTNSLIN